MVIFETKIILWASGGFIRVYRDSTAYLKNHISKKTYYMKNDQKTVRLKYSMVDVCCIENFSVSKRTPAGYIRHKRVTLSTDLKWVHLPLHFPHAGYDRHHREKRVAEALPKSTNSIYNGDILCNYTVFFHCSGDTCTSSKIWFQNLPLQSRPCL